MDKPHVLQSGTKVRFPTTEITGNHSDHEILRGTLQEFVLIQTPIGNSKNYLFFPLKSHNKV